MPHRRLLLVLVLSCAVPEGNAAAIASGRNWQIWLDTIECEAAGSLMTIAMRVRYLGPDGAVEAPVSRLVDGNAKRYLPRSLVWRSGSKRLAELLAAGGLRNVRSESSAGVELKFPLGGASGELKLEFGDIKTFLVARTGASACAGLLRPDEIEPPRAAPRARLEAAKLDFPVYRGRYPCIANSTIEAEFPPYLPRQLLLFGRGYLPNAREIDLPMGWASAQAYFYVGPDDVIAVENAARRALITDFPAYSASVRYFTFNWGTQKAESGNDMYSIGIYELRRCPK